MHGVRRRFWLAMLVTAIAAGATAVAAAASTPRTGTFHATGKVRFTFALARGRCSVPPNNLRDDRAKRGRREPGLCFSSRSSVRPALDCPGAATLKGVTVPIAIFDDLRLPGSGTLRVRAYNFVPHRRRPSGFTELDVTVSGAAAHGSLRVTLPDFRGGTCDSHALRFTAKRS